MRTQMNTLGYNETEAKHCNLDPNAKTDWTITV